MTQYGFYFDQRRCTGCQTCTLACKSFHQLPPGPLKYLKIYQYEKASFPHVRIHVQWIPCYHCEQPACVDSCPVDAIQKEDRFGAVRIDSDVCIGCRQCYDACPYGAPVFACDEADAKARKCDMCYDRLLDGQPPVCVLSCPLRALDFGPLAELRPKYGQRRTLADLPDAGLTEPAVVFRPSRPKRQLVPYDVDRALSLFMRRDPLPPVYSAPSDVTEIPEHFVGRDRLILKHDSSDALLKMTRNDDG